MAMNALQNLETVLLDHKGEVHVDEAVRLKAVSSIQNMLDFAAQRG
jgi:quinolinate synthase